MNLPPPDYASVESYGKMQMPKLLLCLAINEQSRDRLDARRREIMAEVTVRLNLARNPNQPATPPPTP